MAGDLTLTQRSPGDLRLPKYRAADLVLTQSGPADLVLRHPGIPRVRLQAALPQLVSLLKIQAEEAGTPVRLQATLPPPVSLMKAAYDNAVWRGVAQGWRLPSEDARSQHRPICAPHRQSPTLHTGSRASWADAGREYARLCALWRQNVHVRVRSCAPHDDATPTRDHLCAPWISLARLRQTRCAPWQQTTPTRKPPACFDWLDLRRTRQHACSSWAAGTPRSVSACAPHRQAARVRHAMPTAGPGVMVYCATVGAGQSSRRNRHSRQNPHARHPAPATWCWYRTATAPWCCADAFRARSRRGRLSFPFDGCMS